MIHLITGYAGYEHITSADDGSFNAAFFGDGQFIMETGNKFGASVIDNNTVRILDGDGMMFGRHFRLAPNSYEDLTITTGTAGTSRIDLICATYMKNETDGTETTYLEVIKGKEASSPSVPNYTRGNILNGAIFNQMPLYKATINGIVLTKLEPMFDTSPTYKALAERYKQEFEQACETHLNSLNVLDTMEEVKANTQGNQLAGALAVKELSNDVVTAQTTANNAKTAASNAQTSANTANTNINTLITDIKAIKYVTSLPSSPNANTLYLIKK